MRRFILGGLLALASVAIFQSAQAAAPVASLGTGPGTYVVNVTADHGSFAISQSTTRNPLTSGGCANSFRRKPNGQQVYLGTACTSAGTIQFSTSLYVVCETPLNLAQDGVTIQTWSLNSPCPPPPPPSVTFTSSSTDSGLVVTGVIIDCAAHLQTTSYAPVTTTEVGTFTNPASVSQSGHAEMVVGSPDTTLSSADPFTGTIVNRIAASGPNHYLYQVAQLGVDEAPGQTITIAATWTLQPADSVAYHDCSAP